MFPRKPFHLVSSHPLGSSVSVPCRVGGGPLRPATEHHRCGHSCHCCRFLRGQQVGGTTLSFSSSFQRGFRLLTPECFAVFTYRCQKGACIALDGGTYRCDCQDGYSGALCNLQVAPTAVVGGSVCGGGGSGGGTLQCLHGRCEQTKDGGERCVCKLGFSGESCSIGEEGGASASVANQSFL